MKFVKLLLLWAFVLVVPLWLGQLTLDAKWLRTTEVIVSLYPGYFLSLAVASGIGLVVRVTALRVLVWALGIHIVVSCSTIYPMPLTFVLGTGLGIVVCYLSARISTRVMAQQAELVFT